LIANGVDATDGASSPAGWWRCATPPAFLGPCDVCAEANEVLSSTTSAAHRQQFHWHNKGYGFRDFLGSLTRATQGDPA